MGSFITTEEIEAGISSEYRHFFRVSSVPIPLSMSSIIEAFWTAASAISPAIWFSHPVQITFSAAPFILKLDNGELRYTPKSNEIINVQIEHLVFIDCNKMMNYEQQPVKVACILEELVHALMHIKDEYLVSTIVASLYPGISLVNGLYTPTDPLKLTNQ